MRKLRSLALAGLVALFASVVPAYADHPFEDDVIRGLVGCPLVPHYPSEGTVRQVPPQVFLDAPEWPVTGGQVVNITGRGLWPNGRPVRGNNDDDLAKIEWNNRLPRDDDGFIIDPSLIKHVCVDGDGIQEGGVGLWFLDIPLAPDGVTARAAAPFGPVYANWRGDFTINTRIPWTVVYPGEETVTITLVVAFVGVDREQLAQGIWPQPKPVVVELPLVVRRGTPTGAS